MSGGMKQVSMIDRTNMALTLARHVINSVPKGENLILSPVSIHVVLGLIAAGSTKGPAREQILGLLRSKSIEEDKSLVSELVSTILADGRALGGPTLAFTNGVWFDQTLTLKPEFDDVLKNCYRAVSSPVDFKTKPDEVLRTVNKWAEGETNGLIRDILPPGSVDPTTTQFILANALYFKGAWEDKFDPYRTREHEFFLSSNTDDSVRVPFMTSRDKQYIKAYDGFKVLRLPYKQGGDSRRRFSMYFFLPGKRNGLPELVRRAGLERRFIDRHIPSSLVRVNDFRIPKFKFGFRFEAKKVLKEMGIVLPFVPGGGGIMEMVDSDIVSKLLYVSEIYHKSWIELNEEGTEAGAATAAEEGCGCSAIRDEEEKIDFVADHPFFFVLREDFSGSILFIGQVVNPLVN